MVLVSTGLIGGFVMLYNVRCPECGGKTKTIPNRALDLWQARCPRCGTTWNLGLGIDTGP
jgi:ribosomal protein S27AE